MKEKKPIFKKWWFWLVVVLFLVGAVGAISGAGGDPAVDSSTPPQGGTSAPADDGGGADASGESKTISTGSYTLPCGVEVSFRDQVRNDVTGKWRFSSTADSTPPADFALEYYQTLFSSDDEVHAVWNATLGTMTRITCSGGLLYVDTLEYVDGEEHDAKTLFSGDVLDSVIIDTATGKPVE